MGFFDLTQKEKETKVKHGHTTMDALSHPEVGMKFHEGLSYWVNIVSVEKERGVVVEIYVGTDKCQGDCIVNHFPNIEELVEHYTYSVRPHVPWVYYLGKDAPLKHMQYYKHFPVYEELASNAHCPVCHVSWRGAVIPTQARHAYGFHKYVCKVAAVEETTPPFRPLAFTCPACGTQWNAKTGELIPNKRSDGNFKIAGI